MSHGSIYTAAGLSMRLLRKMSGKTVTYLILGTVLFCVIYPFLVLLCGSLKSEGDFLMNPLSAPVIPRFDNYIFAWNAAQIPAYTVNSAIVACATVVLTLILAATAAFGLSQFRFKGSRAIYLSFILLLTIPVQIYIIPLYVIVVRLKLANNLLGLILPYTAGSLPLAVFLYAQQGEIAADLLRGGKHVFMEKPMAVSVAQAERILAAAEQGNARLMVAYMKRYDPGNRIARQLIREWKKEQSKGRLLFARSHGFCGDWIAELDTTRMIGTDETISPTSADSLLPHWLPALYRGSYVSYLQQYTHNVNLLRFFLDVSHRDQIHIRMVDLDDDGYTGTVTLQLDGTRCVIESGRTKFHSWEEHTQVYFEGGWIHAWPKGLFVQPQFSEVEIYEGGGTAGYKYPVPHPGSVWHYREEAVQFLSCLKSGAPFESSGEDALLDVTIFEEIYKKYIGAEI